jgi:hypothetical protein
MLRTRLRTGDLAQSRRVDKRRKAFPQAERVARIAHGEQFAVAPEVSFAPGNRLPGHGPAGALQVIAGQKRLVARGAKVPETVGLQLLAAHGTFQM